MKIAATKNLRRVLGCMALVFILPPARAAIYDLALGDSLDRALRMYLPESPPVVRGIVIYGNGAEEDCRGAATDAELAAWADSLGFALVGTSHWLYFADPLELAQFEAGLQRFSEMSGHAELIRAPWLPIGHSNGGQMSYGFNALRPEKVIAFVVSKGGNYNISRPAAAALQTPGLLIAGEVDTDHRITAIRDLFFGNRARGALWAWVEDQGVDHACGNSDELTRPFVEAMVRARYPAAASPATGPVPLLALHEADGWLADPVSCKAGLADIAPYDGFSKDKSVAGWLPNRRLAYIFRAFASYNKATTEATLSSGAGPVAWGTSLTYTLGQPIAPWTAIEFYEGDVLLKRVTPAEGGNLAVETTPTAPGYSVYHALVTFADGTQRTTTPRRVFVRAGSSPAPAIGAIAGSAHVNPGGTTTFRLTATGDGPLTYQWRKDGAAISGATSATFTVANAQAADMGFYSVMVGNSGGSVASDVAILTVSAGHSRLTGLSTRGYVPAGGSLTSGFYLRGSGSKAVIVRGVGPTLGGFGVAGALSDPKMELIPSGRATPLLTNDDWGTNANLPALRAAMPFALVEGSKDAAALTTLSTAIGSGYTVRVVPSGAATAGIAMAEVYDLDATTSPVQITSLSTLGFTGTGENVLTPGFIITGDGPKQLLIRAVGPTLGAAPYNVPGVLADPQFTVIPLGMNFTVASNDNWGDTTALQAAFTQTGAFPLLLGSKDAAAIARLPPGGYTVQATGVGNTTGNVLVEVYDMDP